MNRDPQIPFPSVLPETFDVLLEGETLHTIEGLDSIAALLFRDFTGRKPDSIVLIGHVGERQLSLTLSQVREVVLELFLQFEKAGIQQGNTVQLATYETNSEAYIALLFIALTAYGVAVFLPMYQEINFIEQWGLTVRYDSCIIPGAELARENDVERALQRLQKLQDYCTQKAIPCFDIEADLQLPAILTRVTTTEQQNIFEGPHEEFCHVSPNSPALLVTTTGSTGTPKVVTYDHLGLVTSVSAWQQAGFFSVDLFGGRGFAPLLAHTMGIRTLLNALYLGKPVILVSPDLIANKPETAQYLLRLGAPEHITGGPAVFEVLLHMCRTFPALKAVLSNSLRSVVFSGSPFDTEIANRLEQTFAIRVFNAFGSTESQQIMHTAIGHDQPPALGGLLPGASIALKRLQHGIGRYQLFVNSRFGCSCISGTTGSTRDIYHDLGDVVTLNGSSPKFEGRKSRDYIKDGFGVKIDLRKLQSNYRDLERFCKVYRIYPMQNEPGLAVLLLAGKLAEVTGSNEFVRNLGRQIARVNKALYQKLDPMEYQHATIRRYAVVPAHEVTGKKGTVSDGKILAMHNSLIKQLTRSNTGIDGVFHVAEFDTADALPEQLHNPYVAKLLRVLRMDRSFNRGAGDYLVSDTESPPLTVLDLTGGYGTNLLGHAHPELTDFAVSYLRSAQVVLSDQVSRQEYPGKLAGRLNSIIHQTTGNSYYTLFGSTGSEVVEMALQHACMEWHKKFEELEHNQRLRFGPDHSIEIRSIWADNRRALKNARLCVITSKSSYHGSTTAARSVSGKKAGRKAFRQLNGLKTIPVDDLAENLGRAVKNIVEGHIVTLKVGTMENGIFKIREKAYSRIFAAILEPVLGEGGIRVLSPELPRLLGAYEFPLIIDEIQCGLGRTGTFLASSEYTGDYYLFSKALGGNLAKVSALCISRVRYQPKFGKYGVSTFSGSGFACAIALKNLELIQTENVCQRADEKGRELLRRLEAIRRKYPDVIESVSGKGLMIGVSIKPPESEMLLRILYDRRVLGYLLSSYLFNRHRLRILPTLSAPGVLRIEPSVGIPTKAMDQMALGISKMAELLSSGKTYELSRHLIADDPFEDNRGAIPAYGQLSGRIEKPHPGAVQIGFVAHFTRPEEELRMFSESLVQASDTGLHHLFSKFRDLLELKPFRLYAVNLYGGKVHLTFYAIPVDSALLETMHRSAFRKRITQMIQRAVDQGARDGVRYISLGGYTSILTRNGLQVIPPEGTRVLSGNTLTAVVGYYKFKSQIRDIFRDRELHIAVVGACGNIGSILCSKVIRDPELPLARLGLFGKQPSRLGGLQQDLVQLNPGRKLRSAVHTCLDDLVGYDAALIVVNTNDPILYPRHIRDGLPVVISDLSVPSGVSPEVYQMSNVYVVPFAASVRLEQDQDFLATPCSPPGTALCCLAEAILNAFEEVPENLCGKISAEGFDRMEILARKYGFLDQLGTTRSFKSGKT